MDIAAILVLSAATGTADLADKRFEGDELGDSQLDGDHVHLAFSDLLVPICCFMIAELWLGMTLRVQRKKSWSRTIR